MIDENVSEYLVAQSFEVIFKEIARYIKVVKNFEGLDWVKYAKLRNKEIKNASASSIEELKDLIVRDLDEIAEKGEESKAAGSADSKEIDANEDSSVHEHLLKDFINETRHSF